MNARNQGSNEDSPPLMTEAEASALEDIRRSKPARAVYVESHGDAQLRIGNVIRETDEGFWLSFESNSGGKRGADELVSSGVVVEWSDIDNMPLSRVDVVVGRRLVRTTGRTTVQVVESKSTLQGPARTAVVRPLRRNANQLWIVDGAWEDVPKEQIFTAGFYAFVHQWRWLQPVDPYFDVISEPAGWNGRINGSAELTTRDVKVPLNASLVFDGAHTRIDATAHPTISMPLNDLPNNYLVGARLASDGPPRWEAKYVSIAGASVSWSFDTGHAPSKVDLRSPFIRVRHRTGRAKFTREVYEGISFGAGTDPILRREPPLPPHPSLRADPTGIRTTFFGRPALIYQPPVNGESQKPLVAVLYHGRPFPDDERMALTSLLGYLAGGRAGHILTETFGIDHKLTTDFIDRGAPTDRMSAPVPLSHPNPHAALVTQSLPALADRLAAIYRDGKGNKLDAVFHHYAEGVDSSYPTTRILRMSVAFEALVNLVTGDTDPNEAITSKASFRAVRREICEALGRLTTPSASVLTNDERQRFTRKVDNLNIGSNTARMSTFWRTTRVRRTAADDALIRRLRNDSVHNGFIEDETTRSGLRRTQRHANRLVEIFNRCLLAYLGYEGPVLRADGDGWIQAKSGKPFPAPVMRPGPEVRIEIEATDADPLSPEHSLARESLIRSGRSARRR